MSPEIFGFPNCFSPAALFALPLNEIFVEHYTAIVAVNSRSCRLL